MKKSLYLIPAFALALASCSSNEPFSDNETYDGEVQTNYLSINISSAGATTRASDHDPADGNLSGADKDYEDGIGNENTVKSVRFYFFDEFGKSARVINSNDNFTSYLDWTATEAPEGTGELPSVEDFTPDGNVELQLDAHLIIRTPQGDKVPKYVVAVINPSTDITNATVTDLASLNALAAKFNVTTNNPFVMSSSVYSDKNDGTGSVIEEIDVTDYIESTEAAAINHPVPLKVERVNAKVRLSIDATLTGNSDNKTLSGEDGSTTTLYYTGKQSNENDPATKIYLKLLGWNVTCTTKKSFLMKHIQPTWTNTDLFGNDVWNWSSNSLGRCFWAINPSLNFNNNAEDSDYSFGNFTNHAGLIQYFDSNDGHVNYTYLQENAAPFATPNAATANPTQVIIAAQLVNESGQQIELYEWATNNYTKDDLLTNLANAANIYMITEQEGTEPGRTETVWTKLDKTYFKFASAESINKFDESGNGRYLSYIQLDTEKLKDSEDNPLQLTRTNGGNAENYGDIDASLITLGAAKVWTEGKTYFYFPIQHLGTIGSDGTTYPATYGIVRNHVYDATITALSGLGTPVFDPSLTIIPEKPNDQISIIAAQIDVLSWRIVKNNVQIGW